MPEVLEKIKFARGICDKLNLRQGGKVPKDGETLPPFDIQVDGGIDDQTAPLCVKAGANHLVAGTYLFKGEGMAEKVKGLRG